MRSGRNVAVAKSRLNHWLPLVRMAVLVSQGDHIWCVVWSEEDGQHNTNENLIIMVAEQCQILLIQMTCILNR